MFRERLLVAGGVLCLLFSMLALVAFGVVGVGRDGRGLEASNIDMGFFHSAGRAWQSGVSPYKFEHLDAARESGARINETGFAYPPQIAAFCVGLALLPVPAAKVLTWFINIAAVAALALGCIAMLRQYGSYPWGRWLLPALIVGNPFSAHVMWMGQSTLVVAASVLWAWIAIRRGYPWIGGALLAVASIKPQFAMFPLLWLLLERRFLPVLISGAAMAILALPAIIVSGPISVVAEWLGAVTLYQHQAFAALGNPHVFGLRNLAYVLGWHAPSLAWIAIVATTVLWRYRDRFLDVEIFCLLLALPLLFIYAHDYDIVILAPLAVVSWIRWSRRHVAAFIAWASAMLLFFPQRLLRGFDWPLLLQYRVVIVLAFIVTLLCLATGRSAMKMPLK